MKGAVRRDAIADYIQRAGYARIEEVAPRGVAAGDRYPAAMMGAVTR